MSYLNRSRSHMARLWLRLPGMSTWRRGMIVFAAAALVSAALLAIRPAVGAQHQEPHTIPVEATGSEAPFEAQDVETIRLEHEFIHVRPAPAPRRHVRPAAEPVSPARHRSFVTRAARVLTGDGRHRPEPFPRPASR